MSRLAFGPKPAEMEVTDIATGHFVFSPVEGEPVSYERLGQAISNAGYEIEAAEITLSGTVTDDRHLRTPDGQLFHLSSTEEAVTARLQEASPGSRLVVSGAWATRQGAEVVTVRRIDTAAYEPPEESRED